MTGFLHAYGNALDMCKTKPADAVAIVAKQAGVTPEVAKRDMDEYDFVTFERQLSPDWLGPPGKPGKFAEVLKSTADFLVAQKSIRSAPLSTRSRRRSTRRSWRRRARHRTCGLSWRKAKGEGGERKDLCRCHATIRPLRFPDPRGDGLSLRLEPGKQLVRHVTEPFVEFSKLSIDTLRRKGRCMRSSHRSGLRRRRFRLHRRSRPAAARRPCCRPSPGSSCPPPAASPWPARRSPAPGPTAASSSSSRRCSPG